MSATAISVPRIASTNLQIAAVYKRERLAHLGKPLTASNETGLWAQVSF